MARTREFDEQDVLDRAVELFWDRGYESTSVADLEAHLGIGRQSLYNTFGDKRQLFLRVLTRYAVQNRERLVEALGGPDAGWESLRWYLHGMVEFVCGPEGHRSCLVANSIVEIGPDDREIAGQCSRTQQGMMEQLRTVLDRAKSDEDLPAGFDSAAGATTLMAQMYGYGVLARSGVAAVELHGAVDALLRGLQSS